MSEILNPKRAVFWLVLVAVVLLATTSPVRATAEYVGKDACGECHGDEIEAWRGSHHDLAMQIAIAGTVLGDFDNAVFRYFDETSLFYRQDSGYFVRTSDANGNPADFEIKYVFGVYPLQQYLIEFDDGRLQAFSVAWDTRPQEQGGQKWFHLYPDEHIKHDDPLHWTGHNQNWNFMCAECHTTNLQRNYGLASNTYDTTWSEINVSCEACHGPGSDHVAWAGSVDPQAGNYGLMVDLTVDGGWAIDEHTGLAKTAARSTEVQIQTCARCHSRRILLSNDYVHGAPLTNSYRPQVLMENLYYADGQIMDEVYVYGSFIQSRMYLKGVTCTDCHDPHSLDLKAQGNDLCSTCHLADKYDTEQHHFHLPGSEAAQCVSCHMPARTYMVNDDRRDHSFRVPRPGMSESVGAPDVCTGCHQGRSGKWAADAIEQNNGVAETGHFGTTLHAARTGSLDAEQLLVDLAQDTAQSAIVRATAAQMLGVYLSPMSLQSIAVLLADENPLVRTNAISALQGLEPRLRVRLAGALLSDPVLAVRAEAAYLLADVPGEMLDTDQREAFGIAIDEYIAVQLANAERVESLTNLGNLYLRLGNPKIAQDYYERAIALDPGYAPAYVNLADFYRGQNLDRAAETLLTEAIGGLPQVSSLHHAYGLLLVRKKQLQPALDELKRAVELEPGNVRYRYVYAIALNSTGRAGEALMELERAHEQHQADRDVMSALIGFHRQQGSIDQARKYAARMVKRAPWDRNAQSLLQQLSN